MKTAICAIIKDEHLYLQEWIEWHLGLGFDAIHLFEDKGSKSHQEITDKYDNVYLRRYENDTEVQQILSELGKSARQCNLYRVFADKYKDQYDWIAFIDIDEFVTFEDGYNLEKLSKDYSEYPALLLAWKMINASEHIRRPKGLTTDEYTEEGDLAEGDKSWCSKSIINTKHYQGMKDLHHAIGAVNVDYSTDLNIRLRKKVWLNHYFTKSWEDWCFRIFKKGNIMKGFRTIEQFFECNPKMEYLKDLLINEAPQLTPADGSFWLDRKSRTIFGGNL